VCGVYRRTRNTSRLAGTNQPLVAARSSIPEPSCGRNVWMLGPRRRRPGASVLHPSPAPPPPRELRAGRGLARRRVRAEEGRRRGRRLGRPCRRAPPRQTGSPFPSSTVNRSSSWIRGHIRSVLVLFIAANSQLVLLIRGTMSRFSPQRTAQPRRLASEVFQSPVYCIRLYLYISIWCRFCFSNSFIVALHIGFWHPYRNIFALVDELGISPFTGWKKAAYYSAEGLAVISLLHFGFHSFTELSQ